MDQPLHTSASMPFPPQCTVSSNHEPKQTFPSLRCFLWIFYHILETGDITQKAFHCPITLTLLGPKNMEFAWVRSPEMSTQGYINSVYLQISRFVSLLLQLLFPSSWEEWHQLVVLVSNESQGQHTTPHSQKAMWMFLIVCHDFLAQ